MNLLPGSEPYFKSGNNMGVLFLHGFTATPFEFLAFSETFVNQGYTVSIPLLRGHGTEVEKLQKCKWYEWVEDSKNALFELRKRCKKIIVIGQSMGGTLAIHLAAHYQVEGVVALAPGLYLKNKASFMAPIAAPILRYISKKHGPDIKDERAKKSIVCYDKTPLKAVAQLIKLFQHVTYDLPEVYSPALLFHSKKDHVISYKSSKYIYQNISSITKRILTLKNSYHVLSLDFEKDIIIDESEKFVKNIFT